MNMASIFFSTAQTGSMDTLSVILYVVEGFIVMIANACLFLRIIYVPYTRQQKEFVIIASCVLFDTIYGCAYFCSGMWRVYIYFNYDYVPLSTRWQCFFTPQVMLFTIILTASGYLLIITTVDRLICIFFPLVYFKTSTTVFYWLMVIPYLLSIPTFILTLIGAKEEDSKYTESSLCVTPSGVPVNLYTKLKMIRIVCCLLVAVIYIPIGIKAHTILRKHQPTAGMSQECQKKVLKLTGTITLITLNNLILFTVPDTITFFYPTTGTFIFYLMNLNKGVVNLIILFVTQKSIRRLFYRRAGKVQNSSHNKPIRTFTHTKTQETMF